MPIPYSEQKSEELKALFSNKRSLSDVIFDETPKIKELLQSNANPSTRLDPLGNSILLLSILYNNEELADYIIQIDSEKCSLNQKDTFNPEALNTPLILAIKKGIYGVAIKLIETGCDIDEVSGIEDYTALHFACALLGIDFEPKVSSPRASMSHDREVEDKANNTDKKTLEDVIDALIQHGADVSKKNFFDQTPLDLLNYQYRKEEFEKYLFSLPTEAWVLYKLDVRGDVWREFEKAAKEFEAELVKHLKAVDRENPDADLWQLRDEREEAWIQSQQGELRRCADFHFGSEHLRRERDKLENKISNASGSDAKNLIQQLQALEKQSANYSLMEVVSKERGLKILSEITRATVVETDFKWNGNTLIFDKGEHHFSLRVIPCEVTHTRRETHPLSTLSSCCWHRKYSEPEQLPSRLTLNRDMYYKMNEDIICRIQSQLGHPPKFSCS